MQGCLKVKKGKEVANNGNYNRLSRSKLRMSTSCSRFRPLLASLSLLLAPFSVSRADLVTDWNALALDTMRSSVESPFVARDLAILHTAIYNASESIRGV